MAPDELVARIREAFADVVCPSALTSGPIGYLHDPLSHFEYDMQQWPDFGLERAFRYVELLGVFTPQAYRFYLPKFLIAAIDPACRPEVTDGLVGNLFPPPEDSLQERARFEARVGLVTAAQADAVRDFLRFIAERDAEEYAFDEDDERARNPQRALDLYWARA
jgi:hypothetical protein